MSDDFPSFEQRFQQLAGEVRALSARVDELALRLSGAESPPQEYRDCHVSAENGPVPPLLKADWTGATVLAGAAAVCFLLVVALILRTIVDNRIIDQPIGAVAGLVYATVILGYGYYRARSRRRFASLSTTCGVTLVLAIVIETHFRFGLLPAGAAYCILAATLGLMLAAALRYRAFGAFDIAVPGASLVAISINFPDGDFVYVGGVLTIAIISAFAAAAEPKTRWLVYSMLAVAGFYWMWWAIELGVPLSRGVPPDESLQANWYHPALLAFVLLYAGQCVYAALRTGRVVGVFECAAPVVTSTAAYVASYQVANAGPLAPHWVAWVGCGGALLYAGLAVWLASRGEKGRRLATWLAVAFSVLVALSIPAAFGNNTVAVLVWSLVSVAACMYARGRLELPAAVAAILLQVYGCVYALWAGVFAIGESRAAARTVAMACLCAICVFHYARLHHKPDEHGMPTAVLPQHMRPAGIVVLFAGLIYAFGAGRTILYGVLANALDDVSRYFECGQSALINIGALALAALALRWMRKDLLASAIVVALVGAAKVFLYDLLRIQGVPLVLSVLVFAITTTAGSLIWNRWQRLTETDESGPPNNPA